MIEISGLKKSYKTGKVDFQALKGVSLSISQGEFVAIMGPSGSGKSTLLHIMGFLDSPDAGSYRLEGHETAGLSDDEYAEWRKRKIGFVFQQFHLLPRMNVRDNVKLPLIYAGRPGTDGLVSPLLESVGLGDKADNLSTELSGGERQRVAIARSLVNGPEIILADEPTGNLDSATQTEIMNLFVELNRQGRTVVIVTHEEEVAEYAARIVKLKDGLIVSDQKKNNRRKSGPDEEAANGMKVKAPSVLSKVEFSDYIRQALNAVLGNKLRSLLSMLGIMIGVGAVIAMLALGEGARLSIAKSLSSLGSNLLMVMPGAARTGGVSMEAGAVTRLTIQDLDVIRKLDKVSMVSGNVNGRAQVVAGNKNWNTMVQGASTEYETVRSAVPDYGRFFTDQELKSRAKVALLGTTVAAQLFGDADPIGSTIRLNSIVFRVIGILPTRGATGFRDQDDIVIIPLSTAMHRLLGKEYVDSIDVQVADFKDMDQAQDEITSALMKVHEIASPALAGFQVRNMADIQKSLQQTTGAMTTLLGFIAAISLIVGGIGIMNIMLVSVTERTHEIGLRKAIGARRKDILSQFLVEAVLMTFLGGAAGVFLGVFASLLLTWLVHWTTQVSIVAVLVALVFSVLVGMVFGILPARKAAGLNPIDALRYE